MLAQILNQEQTGRSNPAIILSREVVLKGFDDVNES